MLATQEGAPTQPAEQKPKQETSPTAQQPKKVPAPAPAEPASEKGLVTDQAPLPKMSFDVMLDLTLPLGKTADFISRAGLQGFAVSFRYYVKDNLAVGAGASFDGLSKKDSGTTSYKDLTITADHTKQQSFTTLLAKAYYAFRGKKTFEPYLAVGAGAALAAQRLVTGYSALTDSSWHFAAAPEIGVHVDIGQLVLLGAARLTYLPGSQENPSQTFANISLGVAIQ